MNTLKLSLLAALFGLESQCGNTVADTKLEAPPAATGALPAKPDPNCGGGGCGTRAQDEQVAPAVRVPIEGLPSFGNARAPVTLVAFTDYECSYCAKADETISNLRREYGDRLRIVVASHPLPMHDKAGPAARAFLAAAEQGRAEAMHSRLFAKGASLDEDGLVAAAHDVGLDLAAFDRARSGDGVRSSLQGVQTLATRLSIEGTPSFFVNGRRLVGARPIETFRALIDEELGRARALVEKGVPAESVYSTLMLAAPEFSKALLAAETNVPDEVVDVDLVSAPLRGLSALRASDKAPVTVVFFSDFECPYCVKAESTLHALEAANPGKIRIAFRHRPLPMHAHARLAAKASIAAEKQDRFWEYHDVLLTHRDALDRDDLERYAVQIGLDRNRFLRDLDSAETEARIVEDEKRASILGVTGTPTSFVNGRRLVGAQPLNVWQAVIDRPVTK